MKHIDILIVDDEQKFAGMLIKRLELRGCRCAACFDGSSALEWVERNDGCVTLILLDLQLPDIYGTKVLGSIKKVYPDIPVVIITGHGTEKDKTECESLGAHDFINKPISIEKILGLLSRFKETAP